MQSTTFAAAASGRPVAASGSADAGSVRLDPSSFEDLLDRSVLLDLAKNGVSQSRSDDVVADLSSGLVGADIVAVVPRGRLCFQVVLKSEQATKQALRTGLRGKSMLYLVSEFKANIGTWVKIRGVPLYVPHGAVEQIMGTFGKVTRGSEYFMYRGTSITNGTRILRVALQRPVPERLEFTGRPDMTVVFVSHQGQVTVCRECGEVDHKAFDCPQRRKVSASEVKRSPSLSDPNPADKAESSVSTQLDTQDNTKELNKQEKPKSTSHNTQTKKTTLQTTNPLKKQKHKPKKNRTRTQTQTAYSAADESSGTDSEVDIRPYTEHKKSRHRHTDTQKPNNGTDTDSNPPTNIT